jgi:hypothetical protein
MSQKGISLKFRPGKDDDIKVWWDNDPDRAYNLREWIRRGMNGTQTQTTVLEPPKKQLQEVAGDEDNDIDLMSQF